MGKNLTLDTIEYGSAVDVRMSNAIPLTKNTTQKKVVNIVTNTTQKKVVNTVTKKPTSIKTLVKVPTTNAKYCPDGGLYLGQVNGKAKCLAPTPKVDSKDSKEAFDKAKDSGLIKTNDAIVEQPKIDAPKPINSVLNYWWVLGLVGLYLIISKD